MYKGGEIKRGREKKGGRKGEREERTFVPLSRTDRKLK